MTQPLIEYLSKELCWWFSGWPYELMSEWLSEWSNIWVTEQSGEWKICSLSDWLPYCQEMKKLSEVLIINVFLIFPCHSVYQLSHWPVISTVSFMTLAPSEYPCCFPALTWRMCLGRLFPSLMTSSGRCRRHRTPDDTSRTDRTDTATACPDNSFCSLMNFSLLNVPK